MTRIALLLLLLLTLTGCGGNPSNSSSDHDYCEFFRYTAQKDLPAGCIRYFSEKPTATVPGGKGAPTNE